VAIFIEFTEVTNISWAIIATLYLILNNNGALIT